MQSWQRMESLHEGRASSVVRARRGDQLAVIKRLPATASTADRARLRYEHGVLKQLEARGARNVVRAIDLFDDQGVLSLALEDAGASAVGLLQPLRWPLAEALWAASEVALALVDIHRAGYVHKDINPNNVVVNRQRRLAQVIDFGISSVLAREVQQVDTARQLQGTLAYMAPEQTGRMNRALDYRADFFSLGSTLYRMLSGRAPFGQQEVGALVYALLAEQPVPLLDVPEPVQALVQRLMAKAPEERYCSAVGVHHDLVSLLSQLEAGSVHPAFVLGARDVSETFTVSDRVVGRAREVGVLRAAWEGTAPDRRHLLVVKGASGIGKSSLIGELQPAIVQAQGMFVAGKYDQLQRHTPFSALAHAMEEVCRRLLSEPEPTVDLWRRRLQVALGGIGRAVTEVIPALELLVGAQKPLPALALAENENRLVLSLGRLVLALCREQPLAVFFDDIQWADHGTLKLIKHLLQVPDPGRLLLIVAFRDNEVDAAHPVQRLLDDLAKDGPFPSLVELGPLGLPAVTELVQEATHAPVAIARGLAELLLPKAGGNPFYLRDALQHLHEAGLLAFDSGQWRWDPNAVAAAQVSAGVADSMLSRLSQLSQDAQLALGCGACVGGEFGSEVVAQCAGLAHAETLAALLAAQRAGLVFALESDYRYAEGAEASAPLHFRFAHDKVQKAAYELLPAAARPRLHLQIGRRARDAHAQAANGPWLFDVTHHLGEAVSLLAGDAERLGLVRLNLRAAQEALRSGTPAAVRQLCQQGIALLGEGGWQAAHAEMRGLHAAQLGASVLAGELQRAVEQAEALLPRTQSLEEFVETEQVRLEALTSLGQADRAFPLGAAALQRLGVPFGARAGLGQMLAQLGLFKWDTRGRTPEQLAELPFTDDPRMVQLVRLAEAQGHASQKNNTYLLCASLYLAREVVRHGLVRGGSDTFVTMVLMSAVLGDWKAARQWARCVERCAERANGRPVRAESRFLLVAFVGFLDSRPAQLFELCEDIYNAALEEGNPLVACYPVYIAQFLAMLMSIPQALKTMERYAPHLQRHSPFDSHVSQLHQKSMCDWLASYDDKATMQEDDATLHAQLADCVAAARVGIYELYVMYHLLAGRPGRATDFARHVLNAGPGEALEIGMLRGRLYCVVAMTQGALATGAKRVRHPDLLRKASKRIEGVSRANPEIHGGMWRLVQAETAALRGDVAAATAAYDQAVRQMSSNGYHAFAVLGAECAARFARRQGQLLTAGMYARQAIALCNSWGAPRKAALLRSEFDTVLQESERGLERATVVSITRTGTGTVDADVDLPAVMHLAAALSEEARLDRIAQLMLETLQRMAGATRAALLLRGPERFEVISDTAPASVPGDLVTLVARSKESVLISDVGHHESADAYWRSTRAKCALASPLVHRGEVIGVVLLENQLSSGVFTPERLALVELMARQAAIALHNARALQDLDSMVADKTAQLQAAHARVLKLERDATETQMAGGFAHEMRNALGGARYPLDMLMGVTDQAAAGGEPSLESLAAAAEEAGAPLEAWGEVLRTVDKGIARALTITGQILQYAEISQLVAGDETTALGEVVDAVLRDYSPNLAGLHANASVDIDPTLQALARREHAVTMVRNLVDNACDALARQPSGPMKLTIEAHVVDRQVVLQVRDTGVGIAPHARASIFKPFYSTKGSRGRGLGLSLSRKLAQAYGGDLRFASEPEQETRFELVLPQARS